MDTVRCQFCHRDVQAPIHEHTPYCDEKNDAMAQRDIPIIPPAPPVPPLAEQVRQLAELLRLAAESSQKAYDHWDSKIVDKVDRSRRAYENRAQSRARMHIMGEVAISLQDILDGRKARLI